MTTSRPAGAKKARQDIVLDQIDHEILRILAADARTPNNVLAAHVGLAASTCLMRVRRLQDAGVITGFHAAWPQGRWAGRCRRSSRSACSPTPARASAPSRSGSRRCPAC